MCVVEAFAGATARGVPLLFWRTEIRSHSKADVSAVKEAQKWLCTLHFHVAPYLTSFEGMLDGHRLNLQLASSPPTDDEYSTQ
jgi:hypothetical protein